MKSIIFIRIDQRGDYKFSNQLSHFSEKGPKISAAPPVPLLPRLTSLSVSDHSWTTHQSGLTLLTRQSPAPCSRPSDFFSHHVCVQTVAASLKAAPCFLCLPAAP